MKEEKKLFSQDMTQLIKQHEENCTKQQQNLNDQVALLIEKLDIIL